MTRLSHRLILPLLAAVPLLLTSCGDDTGGRTADPSPSGVTTDGTTTGAAHRWTLLSDAPDGEALAAGLYGLTANGVSNHVAVIRAPEGYQQNFGGWTFVSDQPFHAMGFVTAERVPPDPCGTKGQDKYDAAVDPGPSVKDLADALVAQRGAETSEPVPVTVGGHQGLYLTYQVAKGIDVLKCQERAFDIFSTGPGAWYFETSRARAAIWIVDVDGDRVVLAWVAVPGVPRAEMREMTRMVRSARFVEPTT